MSQIESLTAFLTENLPERAMQQFESAIDSASIITAPKALGLEQRRLGIFRYHAVLNWGAFPYRICAPAEVYALILAWLDSYRNEIYDELELADPAVDIEFDEENSSPLEIVVELADSINIRLDKNGNIPLQGQRWVLASPEIMIATGGRLFSGGPSGTPQSPGVPLSEAP
ncbi:phage tail protein [Yersinia thracica]|uniref:phage tail protein n=1 Tax=Yersinia thracica TaxID=2890319 RepID=UPI00157DE0FB|nr:phage tail protein [Yersinia thracica]